MEYTMDYFKNKIGVKLIDESKSVGHDIYRWNYNSDDEDYKALIRDSRGITDLSRSGGAAALSVNLVDTDGKMKSFYVIIVNKKVIDTKYFKFMYNHEIGHIKFEHLKPGVSRNLLNDEIEADNYSFNKLSVDEKKTMSLYGFMNICYHAIIPGAEKLVSIAAAMDTLLFVFNRRKRNICKYITVF